MLGGASVASRLSSGSEFTSSVPACGTEYQPRAQPVDGGFAGQGGGGLAGPRYFVVALRPLDRATICTGSGFGKPAEATGPARPPPTLPGESTVLSPSARF
jgi:hypothetical protein